MKKIIILAIATLSSIFISMGTNRVVISEIMYDSPLNEVITVTPYSNGEFIELYNFEDNSVDLSGWKLTGSGVTETFVFPANTVISSHGFLIIAYRYLNSDFILDSIYQGFSRNEPDAYVEPIYQRKIILSNSGETLTLIDSAGNVVDYIEYDGTSHKTKPNRLSAGNEDGTVGELCVSLQRIKAEYDDSGSIVVDNSHWTVSRIKPYRQHIELVINAGQLGEEPVAENNNNYILTTTYTSADGHSSYNTVNYYNGLGYLSQVVDCNINNSQKDLVSLMEYNQNFQVTKQWTPTPIANNDGAMLVADSLRNAAKMYFEDPSPYSESIYESTCSDRVSKKYNVGKVFYDNNKYSEIKYSKNTEDEVRIFISWKDMFGFGGIYPANSLEKIIYTNEDQVCVHEFTDNNGRLVLRRTFVDGEKLDTYYLYDIFGRLNFVLTPKAVEYIETNDDVECVTDIKFVLDYCYFYKYDEKGNMIEKHTPGKYTSELFVYDDANRLIKYLDGNYEYDSYTDNRYHYSNQYVYDDMDRIVSTVRVQHKGIGSQCEETNVADSVAMYKYDRYDGISDNLQFVPVRNVVSEDDVLSVAKGYKTYEKLLHLRHNSEQQYGERAYYYDIKGRLIQCVESLPFDMLRRTSYKYDFVGNIVTEYTSVKQSQYQWSDIYAKYFEYDNRGKLASSEYVLNDMSIYCLYTYDDLGRLRRKRLYQSRNGEVELSYNYLYDIGNRLTRMNAVSRRPEPKNFFDETINYMLPEDASSVPSYSGNISEIKYTDWNGPEDIAKQSIHSFYYDELSRLTSCENDEGNTEKGMSYDKNGNLLTLQRYKDGALLNDYIMEYDGSRLLALIDIENEAGMLSNTKRRLSAPSNTHTYDTLCPGAKVDEGHLPYIDSYRFYGVDDNMPYTYDFAGNLMYDPTTNLNIKYNMLNLPDVIYNTADDKFLEFSYLADGTKLSMINYMGAGMIYVGPLVYFKINNSIMFGGADFDGGRFFSTSYNGEPDIRFFVTDHLGSVRRVLDADLNLVEQNDYYPFGKRIDDPEKLTADNIYRYNGKESLEIFGIPYSDYGARLFDSNTGRWLQTDPLAQDYPNISPFAFCANNPIRYIDPDGRKIVVNDIVDNELIKYEWRQYDGNWGFYDKSNNLYVGDNEYISNLSTALSQLMNGGEIGYALVSNVAGADEIIKIGLGRGGKNAYYSKKPESGGDISWNPRSTSTIPTENGSKSNIPFISLGHELAHAWDDIQGTMNSGKWFPGAKYMEIYATHMENLIRKENHLPLRTHYATDGYGYGSGPRIIDLSGRSIFYNIDGVTNYNRVSPQERFVY